LHFSTKEGKIFTTSDGKYFDVSTINTGSISEFLKGYGMVIA